MPVLLRVLLCLALVANGIASAQAQVRMALTSAPVGAPHVAMPCHDDAGDRAMPAAPDAGLPGHDACCQDGRCDCPCAPALVQLVLVPRLPDAGPRALPAAAPLLQAHREPRLPHRIRPPIG